MGSLVLLQPVLNNAVKCEKRITGGRGEKEGFKKAKNHVT